MTKHVWSIICSKSIIDMNSQNMSLIDVLEEVTLSKAPNIKIRKVKTGYGFVPMRFELVSLWIRDNLKEKSVARSRISVCDKLGYITHSTEVDVDLRECERTRIIRRFYRLPVRDKGQYWLGIELKEENEEKWVEVSRVPLKVNFESEERKITKISQAVKNG